MANGDNELRYATGADVLHSLFERVQIDGVCVVEVWTTTEGELVLCRRELPQLPHGRLSRESGRRLDALQAKLEL